MKKNDYKMRPVPARIVAAVGGQQVLRKLICLSLCGNEQIRFTSALTGTAGAVSM